MGSPLFKSSTARHHSQKKERLQGLAHRALALANPDAVLRLLSDAAADACAPCTVLLVQHRETGQEAATWLATSPGFTPPALHSYAGSGELASVQASFAS